MFAFSTNFEKEFGSKCGKLTWLVYSTGFPLIKADNTSMESLFGQMKKAPYKAHLKAQRQVFIETKSQKFCASLRTFSQKEALGRIVTGPRLNSPIELGKENTILGEVRCPPIPRPILLLAFLLCPKQDIRLICPTNSEQEILSKALETNFPLMTQSLQSIHLVNKLPYSKHPIPPNAPYLYASSLNGDVSVFPNGFADLKRMARDRYCCVVRCLDTIPYPKMQFWCTCACFAENGHCSGELLVSDKHSLYDHQLHHQITTGVTTHNPVSLPANFNSHLSEIEQIPATQVDYFAQCLSDNQLREAVKWGGFSLRRITLKTMSKSRCYRTLYSGTDVRRLANMFENRHSTSVSATIATKEEGAKLYKKFHTMMSELVAFRRDIHDARYKLKHRCRSMADQKYLNYVMRDWRSVCHKYCLDCKKTTEDGPGGVLYFLHVSYGTVRHIQFPTAGIFPPFAQLNTSLLHDSSDEECSNATPNAANVDAQRSVEHASQESVLTNLNNSLLVDSSDEECSNATPNAANVDAQRSVEHASQESVPTNASSRLSSVVIPVNMEVDYRLEVVGGQEHITLYTSEFTEDHASQWDQWFDIAYAGQVERIAQHNSGGRTVTTRRQALQDSTAPSNCPICLEVVHKKEQAFNELCEHRICHPCCRQLYTVSPMLEHSDGTHAFFRAGRCPMCRVFPEFWCVDREDGRTSHVCNEDSKEVAGFYQYHKPGTGVKSYAATIFSKNEWNVYIDLYCGNKTELLYEQDPFAIAFDETARNMLHRNLVKASIKPDEKFRCSHCHQERDWEKKCFIPSCDSNCAKKIMCVSCAVVLQHDEERNESSRQAPRTLDGHFKLRCHKCRGRGTIYRVDSMRLMMPQGFAFYHYDSARTLYNETRNIYASVACDRDSDVETIVAID
jgi:hypothetical protein